MIVQVESGELADFEERGAEVEEPLDPLTGQELAAVGVTLASRRRTAERGLRDPLAQSCGEGLISGLQEPEALVVDVEGGGKLRHGPRHIPRRKAEGRIASLAAGR